MKQAKKCSIVVNAAYYYLPDCGEMDGMDNSRDTLEPGLPITRAISLPYVQNVKIKWKILGSEPLQSIGPLISHVIFMLHCHVIAIRE